MEWMLIVYLCGLVVYPVLCGFYMQESGEWDLVGIVILSFLIWPIAVFLTIAILLGVCISKIWRSL